MDDDSSRTAQPMDERSGATQRTDLDMRMPGDGFGLDPDRPERDPTPEEARRAFGEGERAGEGEREAAATGTPAADTGTPAADLGIETSADVQINSGGGGSSD